MILDSSAIIAIVFQEPDFEILLDKLGQTNNASIGALTLVETSIVLSARLKRDARGLISRFIDEGEIAVIPFGDSHYSTAVHAWLHYGKGRDPAGLNFGDCLSYATAKIAGRPLLCIGNDFAKPISTSFNASRPDSGIQDNGVHFSPQMIEKMVSKPLSLATTSILGQPPQSLQKSYGLFIS